MKKFNFLFLLMFLPFVGFTGCEKKPVGEVEPMHWDRDMCERCKMAISERKFAVQVINPQNGRVYKFDDIGCALLWMDEEKIPWKEKAIIWITDAKSGKWINARTALYADGAITPMAFGFGAYTKETLPKGAKVFDFTEVTKRVKEIEAQNSAKVRAY